MDFIAKGPIEAAAHTFAQRAAAYRAELQSVKAAFEAGQAEQWAEIGAWVHARDAIVQPVLRHAANVLNANHSLADVRANESAASSS